MKKYFSLYDLMYLVPIVVTSVLTTVINFTQSGTVAVIQVVLLAFGYELIYYIAKLYIPKTFNFLDLVKLLIAMVLAYIIYLIPFWVSKTADADIFDITLFIGVISLAVLVIGGPVVMLLKRAKIKKTEKSEEE